jgi:hypothetical protein
MTCYVVPFAFSRFQEAAAHSMGEQFPRDQVQSATEEATADVHPQEGSASQEHEEVDVTIMDAERAALGGELPSDSFNLPEHLRGLQGMVDQIVDDIVQDSEDPRQVADARRVAIGYVERRISSVRAFERLAKQPA